MKRTIILVAALLLAMGGDAVPSYRFLTVKGTVRIVHAGVERRARAGEDAVAGDEVRTGLWGRAVLEQAEHGARFEILPASHVRLGGPEAGILLVLERGRLKAAFAALLALEERVVATPAALLAVRGTRYAVEVDADGLAALAVFEGAVEVRPHDPAQPVTTVRAKELCRFGPHLAPQRGPLPPAATEERWRGGLMGSPGTQPRASGERKDTAPSPAAKGGHPRPPGGRSGGQ